jgi:hypothetical protein
MNFSAPNFLCFGLFPPPRGLIPSALRGGKERAQAAAAKMKSPLPPAGGEGGGKRRGHAHRPCRHVLRIPPSYLPPLAGGGFLLCLSALLPLSCLSCPLSGAGGGAKRRVRVMAALAPSPVRLRLRFGVTTSPQGEVFFPATPLLPASPTVTPHMLRGLGETG